MSYQPNRMASIPPVVKNLLIINILVFFATYVLGSQGIDLTKYLALYHWTAPEFKPWQLITYQFMHGDSIGNVESGLLHLFSNMFALWMFGSVLENYMTSKRFLVFYLSCGVGAACIFMAVNGYQYHALHESINHFNNNPTYKEYVSFLTQNHPSPFSSQDPLWALKNMWESNPMDAAYSSRASGMLDQYYHAMISNPCVGASGAVFGLLFAFGYLFPNTLMMLLFLPIPIKAKYFVAFYAVFEIYTGLQNNPADNVAHTAHIGGMIIAYILLKLWRHSIHRNYFT